MKLSNYPCWVLAITLIIFVPTNAQAQEMIGQSLEERNPVNQNVVMPPMQSGVTLTAVGQYCGINGPCFHWGFDFDPAGGPIGGTIEDTIQLDDGNGGTVTYHLSGTQSGYFEGGDGGKVSGMWSASSLNETSGNSESFTIDWEGNLYSNGTGQGTGEDANWNVTFDGQAFQSALASSPTLASVPTLESMPTPEEFVTEVINIWPPSTEQMVKTWPELDVAIVEILNQDDAIIARDEQGVYYAIDNQGMKKPLPAEMQSVLQMNNEFGLLQDAKLLWASPAVQAFAAVNGNAAVEAITGTGSYQYYSIPEWLKQRQYLKVTTSCKGGFCTPLTTYSVLRSSLWVSALASSEHSSVRGTINGGGDFIYVPSPNTMEFASLYFMPPSVGNQQPYLGVQVLDVADRAVIQMVQSGSPAENAGLQVNDQVVSVSGVYLDDSQNTLSKLIGQHSGGEQVELGVIHNGDSSVSPISITLATLLPPVIITPSAEITITNNTELVVDIGFNGATGVSVLGDNAKVREPVTGSEVNVPAGSAVIVVPGYQIGNPISVGQNQITHWWLGEHPPTPVSNIEPIKTPLTVGPLLIGFGALGLCVVAGLFLIGMFLILNRRQPARVAQPSLRAKPAPPEKLQTKSDEHKPPPPESLSKKK